MDTPTIDITLYPQLAALACVETAAPLMQELGWDETHLGRLEHFPTRLILLIVTHDMERVDAYGGEDSYPPGLILDWLVQPSDESGLNMDYFGSDSAPQESYDEILSYLPAWGDVPNSNPNPEASEEDEELDGEDGPADEDWLNELKRKRTEEAKAPRPDAFSDAQQSDPLQALKDKGMKGWAFGMPRHNYDPRLTPGRLSGLGAIRGIHMDECMKHAKLGKVRNGFKNPADYTGLKFLDGTVFHLGLIRPEARFQTAERRVLLIENPPEIGVGTQDELDRAPHPHLITLSNQAWRKGMEVEEGKIELSHVVTYMLAHPEQVLESTGKNRATCLFMVEDFFQHEGRPLVKHLMV